MRHQTRFLRKHQKEKEVGILDTVLRRREAVTAYRTIDGGHPAPYPDMTDEQLYNYEIAFNVPKKTFDRPPISARAAMHETRPESAFEAGMDAVRGDGTAFDRAPAASMAGHGAGWHDRHDSGAAMREPPAFATDDGASTIEQLATDAAADESASPLYADQQESLNHPLKADDTGPLDLSKPVRTITTKQPVEIITTRARHPIYKVHGYIDDDDVVTVFTLDGRLSEHGAKFLENIPEEHELWLNIYPNRNAYSRERYFVTQHDSKEEADAAASAERIGCVRADIKGGP